MEKYRILSDIFAVPGLFCLFGGGLRWLAGQGAFRGIGYVMKNAIKGFSLRRSCQRVRYEPLTDEVKKDTSSDLASSATFPSRGRLRGNGAAVLLITGVILLTASGVFTGLYYS